MVSNMTKAEKELLLIDLCARLPYDVMMCSMEDDGLGNFSQGESYELKPTDMYYRFDDYDRDIPYLRPMSSMTEEEKKDYELLCDYYMDDKEEKHYFNNFATLDWMNQKHFDYRGLIKLGLALEAPKGMYNKKEGNT